MTLVLNAVVLKSHLLMQLCMRVTMSLLVRLHISFPELEDGQLVVLDISLEVPIPNIQVPYHLDSQIL